MASLDSKRTCIDNSCLKDTDMLLTAMPVTKYRGTGPGVM